MVLLHFQMGRVIRHPFCIPLQCMLVFVVLKENVGETEALNLFVKFRLVRGLPPSMGKSNTSFLVSHRVRIT